MSKSLLSVTGLLIITSIAYLFSSVTTSAEPSLPTTSAVPSVTLRAASGETIEFLAQNGRETDGTPSLAHKLPHLLLHRNGVLTESQERTLIVEVAGIEVPSSGVTITLRVETQHGDPDRGSSGQRILVWQESQSVANTQGVTQTGVTALFVREFSAAVNAGPETLATPTDYFRYEITVVDTDDPVTDPLYTLAGEHGFLMENEWTVSLPEVHEESDGAAPHELVIFYCDMFPFQTAGERLGRAHVLSYVHAELAPAMVQAFDNQVNGWEMGPWYGEWASFRGEKRLSVALAMPGTWYHGRALNHSGMSVLTYDDNPLGVQYERLIDEHMSSFRHELFHNLQLNIARHAGSDNFEHWKFFTEGQAVMVGSVGSGKLATKAGDNYVSRANQFLRTGLNKSYARLDPYQAAIYWRFLYEQCGGLEHPAAGMQIIRRSLEALYAEERAAGDIIEKLPSVMDRALDGSSCPYQTYEESLKAFARANYALRLENGHCGTVDLAECAATYFDPGGVYIEPWLETELAYAGDGLTHDGSIPASYGMDLIEVNLDLSLHGKPLRISLENLEPTRFDVQIWKLSPGAEKPRALSPLPEAFRLVSGDLQIYAIEHLDTTVYDRLALIITRLDPHETMDQTGAYHLVLESTG